MKFYVEFEMPGLPPSPNAKGKHWAENHRVRKRWRRDAFLAFKAAAGPMPHLDWIRVRYTRMSSREPDTDNAVAATKNLQDGLVDAVKSGDGNEAFDDTPDKLVGEWRWEKAARGKGRMLIEIWGGVTE